jgi:hypothetical protein
LEIVAALAGIASVIVAWIVGCKLLLIGRRTGQLPEFLIGLGLLMAGGFWSPLMAVGRQATGLSDGVRVALVVCGGLSGIVGMICIAVFTRRVFRPEQSWALALTAAFTCAIVALYAAQTFQPGWLTFAREERGPWTHVSAVGGVIYTWSCVEAWKAHAMLSRRMRLGLADPVVTDRMRLWMWLQLNSMLASVVFATFQQLGIPVAGTTIGLLLGALAGFLSAVFLTLAFMPPTSYLDAVRRRALVEA